jgi:hypothetical protein
MLLNGAAQIEKTASPFPQFTMLHSVTCVQLRLIIVLGNCGCVAVASFLEVPSPLDLRSLATSVIISSQDIIFFWTFNLKL